MYCVSRKEKRRMRAKKSISIVLIGILTTILITTANPLIASVSASDSINDWPMIGHDPAGTYFSPSSAPNTNETAWIADLPDAGAGWWPYPIVSEGRIFIGLDGNLTAWSEDNGALLWSRQAPEGFGSPSNVAAGGGMVFAVTYEGNVYASDVVTGEHIWSLAGSYGLGPPVYTEGRLYLGGGAYPVEPPYTGIVVCLNATTGEQIWSYSPTQDLVNSISIAYGKVYVGCGHWETPTNGAVYCLDMYDGSYIWSFDSGRDYTGAVTVADGMVYFSASYEGSDLIVCALDAADGSIVWSTTRYTYADAGMIAVAYGKLFLRFGYGGSGVYALNETNGDEIWAFRTSDAPLWVTVADGKVFFGPCYPSHTFYAVNESTGEIIWTYELSGSTEGRSGAVAHGRVYVVDYSSLKLYAFGPAQRPWYYKPTYVDYAPSGMPDFDERQWGTYNWTYGGAWSHCGPVAIANSLWWLDSEFETLSIPPPIMSDHFPLVSAFGPWDDHDPKNVAPLVEKLAWFMDTDGRLTGLLHKGTSAVDMQAGVTHYLSWSGVNPPGDVDGDGYVNQTDVDLVALALGSVPGAPNWNLAADLNQDNRVDFVDANIVAANLGKMGRFYEHTINQPEFRDLAQEVERCQDVVLSIGYWIWTGSSWYREDGHFVTVAGIDLVDSKVAISDPIRDAFENGLIAEGRIPVPHDHMPPEPPYITHNNAAYVSQDIYSVVPVISPSPGLPGKWALANFPPETPGFIAVIEDAVITSPASVHDIAVTNITTCKDGCTPMRVICQNYSAHVNVTVANLGNYTETFNLILYANLTWIASQGGIVSAGDETTVYLVWNTSGFAFGDYTLSAYAAPVVGETSVGDNNYTDGTVRVTKVGDINGDGIRNMMDVGPAARGFLTTPGVPFYNPNADLTDDHKIDMKDIGTIARYCFVP
jgi:outer membrane protein assembly factor BamB